jgi:DNA-binding response OmpR family regulator
MLALDANTGLRFSDNVAPRLTSASAIPPSRLMVVDDDECMRVYLASILRSASYEVDVVESGKEALRLLHTRNYDILLTDCLMPGMSGLALCRRVRAEFPDKSPYIVMLTVKDTREDRDAGLQSGADEYIIKGAPKSEVLARLNRGRAPVRRSSASMNVTYHIPLCAAGAARSRANIALWNSYLLSTCVRSMVRMGWDYTT